MPKANPYTSLLNYSLAVKSAILFSLCLLIFSCSGLKLDKESNCLNDRAACFKADKTAPRFDSSNPAAGPANPYAVLPYVDVTFSEEVKNGEEKMAYSIDRSANIGALANGGLNLNIVSAQKIGPYTYRVTLSGSVTTGVIRLRFADILDYGGNALSGIAYVDYQGSASVGITLNVVRNGTTLPVYGASNNGNGAHGSVDIKFSHQFTADNANTYTVYRTDGGVSCPPTGIFSSLQTNPNLQANTEVVVANVPATTFQTANDRVVVCVNNLNNPAATGVASWPIIRDDVPPTVSSANKVTDIYRDPETVLLTCGNNMDQIAVTTAMQQTTAPIDPPDPDFTNGIMTTGSLYSSGISVPNPANPTVMKIRWRCMDKSGNKEAVSKQIQMTIDNTVPAVIVNLDATYRAFVSSAVGANNSTTLNFTSDQANKEFRIVKGDALCSPDGAPDSAVPPLSASLIGPGLNSTNVVANGANTPQVINATSFDNGLNNVRICVQGPVATIWGTAYLQITRDDGPITVSPSVVGGDYGAAQNLSISCSGNVDKIAYTVSTQLGAAAPAPPANPVFTGGAITVGQELTGPYNTPDASTTIIKYKCLDKSGNQSSVGQQQYRIDASLPSVQFVSTNRIATSSAGSAFNDVAVTWNSSRAGLPYRIRRVLDCNDAGDPGNTILSGTTPAVGTNEVSTLLNTLFPTNHMQYPLRICVFNYINQVSYQTTAINIMRDNIAPTFGGLTSINSPATGSFTVNWSAASDTGGSGVSFYRVYQTQIAGDYSAAQVYIVPAPATTFTATGLNPLNTYYFIAGAVDNAGNETQVTAAELASKPVTRILISGLSGNMRLSDGTTISPLYSADIAAPGALWAGALGIGSTYNFSVSQHPPGQVCSIKEKQFGTLSADLTININCITGQMVAGRFQALPTGSMSYMLYQTRAEVWSTLGADANSIAITGTNIYFGSYDCDAGAPVAPCIYRLPIAGFVSTPLISNLPAVARGIASDGTNLYYTTLSPDNRLYKYPLSGGAPIEIAAGFNNPYAIALENGQVYVCNRGAGEIVRFDFAANTKFTVASGISGGPLGLAIVGSDLYFTSGGTHAIYRVPKTGGAITTMYGSSGSGGYQDNFTTLARFNEPHDLVYDGLDNLFVTEYQGHRVRRVRLSTGRVITLAGDGQSAIYSNGTGVTAKIANPVGIGTDGRNLFISLHGPDKRIVKLFDLGLKGHWPLANNAEDYGSDAAPVAGVWSGTAAYATGRYNDANGTADFTGANHVSTKDIVLTANQPFTLAAWVKVTDLSAARPIIGNLSNYEFQLYVATNGSVNFQNWYSSGGLSNYLAGTSGGVIKPGTWAHVAYVFRNGSAPQPGGRIFINGHDMTAVSTQASSVSLDSYASSVTIGATLSTASKFVGSMADVRVYSRALSEGEINELAQDANSTLVGAPYNKAGTELLAHYESANYASSGAFAENLLGSATNATGKDGDAAGAFAFDGSYSLSVTTTSLAALPLKNAPRTMCTFVNPAAYPPNGAFTSPVSYGSTGSLHEFGLALSTDGSGNAFVANTYNSVVDHVIAHRVPLRTWTHFCATYDGTNARLYINGVLLGTKTVTIDTSITSGALRVGAWFDDLHRFQGVIDDTRIYNKALSDFEIRQLSLQVPAGLIARYDLGADTNDVSGFGNDMTNSGATQTDDRFGVNSTAHKFNGSGGFMSAGAVTAATSNATFAAWINPAATAATYNGIFENWNGSSGAGGSGGGLFLNPSGQLIFLTKGAGADNDCSTTYVPPVGVYTHIAATQSFSPTTIAIYVNGSRITTCTPGGTPSIFNNGQSLRVGKSVWPDTFNGNIDDARLYNRALTQAEVQALVQQPNKRIYVTNNIYNGNLGGIAGADTKCNAVDGNKPAASGTFKALLVDSGASLLRRACTMQNCTGGGGVSQGIDWVLRPNVTYLRGQDGQQVFTANFNGVFDFGAGSFASAIHTTAFTVWTGINFGVGGQWTIDGGPGQCNSWTGNGTNGVYGNSAAVTQTAAVSPAGAMYDGYEAATCITPRRLYCVEQ